ncbi:MAG: hypothetical protein ABIS69_06715, partial [Sediminibacterium sp.]
IDFDNIYEIEWLAPDFSYGRFFSETPSGQVELYVSILASNNPFLGQIPNLAFGPLKEDGSIDDDAKIKHVDNSKVYSTMLFSGLTFLKTQNQSFIGVDGSNHIRAFLYYKVLQLNYDYLAQYFKVLGVKYYIRLLRGRHKTDHYTTDSEDVTVIPTDITKLLRIENRKLFNYFVLKRLI